MRKRLTILVLIFVLVFGIGGCTPVEPVEEDIDFSLLTVDNFSDEYLEVVQPIDSVVVEIVSELLGENADFFLQNIRLQSMRCWREAFSKVSLLFYIEADNFFDDNVKSDFLRVCYLIQLENVSTDLNNYNAVKNFIEENAVRRGKNSYISKVKPLAEAAADAIQNIYNDFKNSGKEIEVSSSGENNHIFITKNNEQEYNLIRDFINLCISEKRVNDSQEWQTVPKWQSVPTINDCEIQIWIGGGYTDGIIELENFVLRDIVLYVKSDNSTLWFEFDFDRELLTTELALYFTGCYMPGYSTPFDPVPYNSEYLEFLQLLVSVIDQNANCLYANFGADDQNMFIRLWGNIN